MSSGLQDLHSFWSSLQRSLAPLKFIHLRLSLVMEVCEAGCSFNAFSLGNKRMSKVREPLIIRSNCFSANNTLNSILLWAITGVTGIFQLQLLQNSWVWEQEIKRCSAVSVSPLQETQMWFSRPNLNLKIIHYFEVNFFCFLKNWIFEEYGSQFSWFVKNVQNIISVRLGRV